MGPLRDRERVLSDVMRRGRTLRRRRRVRLASPAAAAAALVVVLLLVSRSTSLDEDIRTEPADRGHSSTTVITTSTTTPERSVPPHARNSTKTQPGATTTTVSSVATTPSTCVPADSRTDPGRTSCWQTSSGPKGNYVTTDPDARGCVVHNVGSHTAVHEDFFCSYDAVRAGGYTSDGPFNMIRITHRDGTTVTYYGYDPPDGSASAARCMPTGFIQPGDHVYVDGRGPSSDPTTSGYTTTSVGDAFHC